MKTSIYYQRLAASISGLILTLIISGSSLSAQINFNSGNLQGINLTNPTTLDFGPDGRLYVTEQYGNVYAYTITRSPAGDYSATAIEHITIIKAIQNHNDDGTLNNTQKRQITGILATGTAANPVLLVAHSDWRVGGGGGGADKNLDTNSGIISKLTWDGTKWVRVDLVRGLARSEENHASNGLQIDSTTNTLFIAVGGLTNAGSPSNNFSLITEYSLSACILSIDLNVINALPTKYDSLNASYYKYDMPTLDDPMRANVNGISDPNQVGYNGIDLYDPFGGNDGLNQAKWVSGGPVQVHASGLRNPYDLVITESGEMYTWNNGANPGWGGHPEYEGTDSVTNNWVNGEPGSTDPGPNDAKVNNLDGLHHITNFGYYGGHPCPVRANPAGSGIFTHDHVNGAGGVNGVFRTAITNDPNTSLPVDWPPVDPSLANPIEADYQNPGVDDLSLFTVKASTNGICEYTASNFGGAMQGNLLVASFNENIYRVQLNAQGSINNAGDVTSMAYGFGTNPLDVVAQGDNDVFPGTIWVVNYGSNTLTVFEPQDFGSCNGNYSTLVDDDLDGYSNADEIDNGTDPCNGANKPSDFDKTEINGFLVSNLNDPDDDDDGLLDNVDPFAWDPNNGADLTVPHNYVLLNGYPGFGIAGLGFTGWMTNYNEDYLDLYKHEDNSDVELVAGGAVGLLSFNNVPVGSAKGSNNDLKNGWQFGMAVDINTPPFHIEAKMLGPVFQGNPMGNQFNGAYIGNGDMDNYVAINVHANNGNPQIEILSENAGVFTSTLYPFVDIDSAAEFNLYLEIDPQNGTVQPKAQTTGAVINVGPSFNLSGALLSAVQTSAPLAVGVMAGRDSTDSIFNATWDNIKSEFVPSTAMGQWSFVNNASSCNSHGTPGSCPEARHEAAYVQVGDKFVLVGGRENGSNVNIYDPATDTWTIGSAPGFSIHHFQAVEYDGLLYMVGAMTGNFPNETGLPNIWIYNPSSDEWMMGPAIPTGRIRGSAGCVVYNDKIYLVGGIINGHTSGWVNWLDEYDPATNTWTALADAPNSRDHFHAAVLNDKLYAVAGRRSGSNGSTYNDTEEDVDVYDFETNTWSTLPNPIPTERAGNTVAVLGNEILVIGGEKQNGLAKNETEALYGPTGTWRALDTLNEGRHGTQAIVNNNTIYLASGSRERGGGASKITMTQEVFAFNSPGTPVLTPYNNSSIVASIGNISFYSVNSGDSITQTFNISNTGGDKGILIKDLAFSDGTFLHASAEHGLPFHLRPGATVQISVAYAPSGSHTLDSELIILHTGIGDSTTINITGSSSGNLLSVNPATHTYGTTEINNSSSATFTINNPSVTTIQIDSVSFGGAIPGDYSTSFTGAVISSGNSTNLDVDFTPSSYTPAVKDAVMYIYHTGDNSPLSVNLSGNVGCPIAGIPCDDGNANTFGDIQDGNCNCVGSIYTGNGGVGCNDFIEQNGLLVMEAESEVAASSDWYLGTTDSVNGFDLSDRSGSYYMWKAFCGTAPNYNNCGGVQSAQDANAITYSFYINNPGKYKLMIRSWQPDIGPDPDTENNDCWVQFPTNGGYTEKWDGSDSTAFDTNDWLKTYQNKPGDWEWQTKTVDHSTYFIYSQFDSVGTYQLKIAGRSKLFAIDRIVLFRDGNPSNNYGEGLATKQMPAESLRDTCDYTTLYAYPRNHSFDPTFIDSTTSAGFTLENLGNTALVVDSVVLSGANAIDFSTDLLAGTLVDSFSTLGYSVNFTPSGPGYAQRHATLTIYHNANNDPIAISLVGDIACPAAGTSCDDGNSLTTNDIEDGNCNCAGTGPTITIDSPANGTTLPYGDFNVTHTITNWPMGAGSNHFHLKIDGVKINSYYDSLPVLISGLTPGAHQIKLALATVDHNEVGVADSIDVFMCEPAGTACDDGFVNTVNDTTDGNCGCFGRAIQPLYSLHINAGGPAHTTANGLNFIADDHFVNGGTYSQNGKAIANTTEDVLYKSERYSSGLSYAIPVPYQGDYDVTLHFAEIHSGSYNNGARVFDASLEGVQVLNDYDIYASVGSQYAVSHSFSVNVTDGVLDYYSNSSAGDAKISAISIVYTGISLVPSPGNHTFGATNVGDSSTVVLNLDNPNNISIDIDSIEMIGADASEFFVNLTTPVSIPSDSTLAFTAGFSPVNLNSGTKSAQLVVYSSAENSPLTIDFTGAVACPTAGTPCNDNNPLTTNDVEDGNCNCAGNGPTISIDSPSNGATLPYGDFYVNHTITNWPMGAGSNHFHLRIDGIKINSYYDSLPVLITGLTAGAHQIKLALATVDHQEAGVADSIDIFVCDPAGLSCDDGNSSTINDTTDGNCGCAGTAITPVYSMYINSGGPSYTTVDGKNFIADAYFNNGKKYLQNGKAIANTLDDVIYQSERWNANLSYSIPVPFQGDYEVTLYFAEIHSGTYSTGARIMDADIEGAQVLDDYDIFASVGAQTADSRTFPVVVTDGVLNIDFSAVAGNPKLSGIGVVYTGLSLIATPDNFSFNPVVVGQADTADFVLSNSGNTGITIDSLEIIGANAVDFTTNLTTTTVLADSTEAFKVFFAPVGQTPVSRTASLMIYHSGDNTPLTISLSGAIACPAAGTPCDDGNLATTNDVEDGNCNCQGVGPVVSIDNPVEAAVLPYGDFNIDFSLQNWPLNGSNHLDLWIDDVKTNAYYDSLPILISGLSAGTHELRLELEYVDHTEVGSQDSITITICDPAGLSCYDGDPNTVNDTTDGNCGCAGVPLTPAYSMYINSGGNAYTAVDGRQFIADTLFSNGGTYAQNSKTIGNTDDDVIFQTERWNANLAYAIPVPYSGDYQVILYFAEIHSGSYNLGARVMDVSLEGTLVLDDYDIYADVGQQNAVAKSFNVNLTDGILNLDFSSVAGNAKISGIGILYTGISLSVTPDNHSFPAILVGQTDTADFVLGNTSVLDISVDSVKITGATAQDFTTNLSPANVLANSTSGFKVFFSPQSQTPVLRSANLMIYHSGDNTPLVVSLSGSVSCPAAGTPCDDGNLATVNDVEDGNCNCQGVGPIVSIDNPAEGAVLPYGNFNVDFSLQNWPLDGSNHLDLWIDDVKTNAYYDSLPILISGLSAGTHEIRLELEYVDHTEVGAQDSINITICDPAGLTCDDGDANTVNDLTDGNCGCSGSAIAPAYSMYINSGGPAYTAVDGRQFIADNHYLNGSTYTKVKSIGNTDDDILFHSERYDANLSYAIPVPQNGNYEVTLYFAELHNGSSVVGGRVMDISIEGNLIMDDYDIFEEVGKFNAVTHTFVTSITDGVVNLDFTAIAGNAKVCAIGIILPSADLVVTPNNHVFNNTAIGNTDTYSFVLDNIYPTSINIDSVVFNGNEKGDFSTNLSSSWIVGANSDTAFDVDFTPLNNTPQLRNATMTIYHNGTNSPVSITLSGETSCVLVGQSCDDGDANTINDVYDVNCNCEGTFEPLTQTVSNNTTTTTLSVKTTTGVSTWKFYADGVLEATYNSNSVSHNWNGTSSKYFEFFPANNDFSTILDNITWNNSNLTGSLSNKIERMNSVDRIELHNNSYSGSLPAWIGNMSQLDKIYLLGNQLSGSIPNEIGQLTSLTYLDLRNNQMSGSIPITFGNLSNLKILYLSGNSFSGTLPRSLGNIQTLKRILVQGNNISGTIPSELSNLTALQMLLLHVNSLNSYEVGAFTTQKDLTSLFVNNNNLSEEDIDNILLDLVSSLNVPGRVNCTVDLRNNSAPSVSGKALADSLIALGWTVLHDPLPAASVAKGPGDTVDETNRTGEGTDSESNTRLGKDEIANQIVIGLFPNPAQAGSELSINLQGVSPGVLKLEIVNLQGQVIDASFIDVKTGENQYGYHLPDGLAKGQYVLRLSKESWLRNKVVILK